MAEPFLGEIIMFGGNFAPRNWAFCSGQILPINQNQALFSILGTTYGGDGRTSFALPDLRGRAPIGQGHGTDLTNRPLGARGGQATVALGLNQLPNHTHVGDIGGLSATLRAHATADADSNQAAAGTVLSKLQSPATILTYSNANSALVPLVEQDLNATVANAGAGQEHENRQPYLGVNYIIAIQGLFPSRN